MPAVEDASVSLLKYGRRRLSFDFWAGRGASSCSVQLFAFRERSSTFLTTADSDAVRLNNRCRRRL